MQLMQLLQLMQQWVAEPLHQPQANSNCQVNNIAPWGEVVVAIAAATAHCKRVAIIKKFKLKSNEAKLFLEIFL
jgi:hypothetical protein